MSYLDDTLAPAWRTLQTRYAVQRELALAWFRRLNPRERRLVQGMLAIVLTALVWLVLIEPAWTSLANAKAALPALRTQAATVADFANRARGLKHAAPRAPGTLPTPDELQVSLRQAGLEDRQWSLQGPAATVADGQQDSGASLTLKLDQAPAELLLGWLDTAPRDWQLNVVDAELTRARDADKRRLPGRIDGTVTLAPRAQAPR
jgi:general secretion pathway protein M